MSRLPVDAQSDVSISEVEIDRIAEDQPVQLKVSAAVTIAVYLVDGQYYAVDDICTHEFAFLSEGYCEGGVIECPLHQARFDVRTGIPLGPPASICLTRYRTEVQGGVVRIFVPTASCSAYGNPT
ncbi:MAG: non-heme iron oxygenase ferredoxin subunit [Casimicrobiaceae bacterium]